MKRTLIKNATIINEGRSKVGSVVIEDETIAEVRMGNKPSEGSYDEIIDASGCYLIPGVIDDHVHFRDPGLTLKADIRTESRAAAAGGVTSIMDMPNTTPQTTTIDALEAKFDLYAEKCSVNYSCYFGATNSNYTEFDKLDKHRVCGIKLFMGSSTGDMLVDKMNSLLKIFNGTELLIAAHCEDQDTIKENTEKYMQEYLEKFPHQLKMRHGNMPLGYHSKIRSAEACFKSSELAIRLARMADARLHILHLSTARELRLLDDMPYSEDKRITAEACVGHLLFNSSDYTTLGTRIKCNPSIKTSPNQEALLKAIKGNLIDTIATDHAPHLLSDKEGTLQAASGMPMIQFALVSMLDLCDRNLFSIEKLVDKMCHGPAKVYDIDNRGFIRTGYQADLVLIRPDSPWEVTNNCILSKCKWSPVEGRWFNWKVEKTFVNGHLLYENDHVNEAYRGQQLRFKR